MKSLHAGYTADVVVQERGVEGSWINEEKKVMLTVTPTEKTYAVLITLLGDEESGEPEKTVRLKVALFRAGGAAGSLSLKPGALLADASLNDDAWEELGLAQAFTVRTHAICRVELAGDAMSVRELKVGAVDDAIRKDESVLEHVHFDGGEVVLSAGSARLVEFLKEHGGEDAFFNEADGSRRFTRVK